MPRASRGALEGDGAPLNNIEIAQQAKMRRISDVARDRLGIPEDSLEAYGRYKAKVSLDYLKSLESRPDGN